jgi:hypothetical protein
VVAAAWAIGLGCWPFLIWSPLNCTYEDIDINSGRVRHQRYLVGLRIHESIEETSLSRLVAADLGDNPGEWHRVNTFSPLVMHSPHHRYHGAVFQISWLDQMWGSVSFTPAAQRQMAQDVLSLWQSGEGYYPVNDYLLAVESVWFKRLGSNESIESKDLPTTKSVEKRRAAKCPTAVGR